MEAERRQLKLDATAGLVKSGNIISALSVLQFGVLFCRARFSPVVMLFLLKTCRHTDGFMKVPLVKGIFWELIERKKPAREMLATFKDILGLQFGSENGFKPESTSIPDDVIAYTMGLL